MRVRTVTTLLIALGFAFAGETAASDAVIDTKIDDVPDCIAFARKAEKTHGLPDGILQSISTVEASRIQADGSYRAWPWTLNDAGKGLFFDSPQQVLEYLDANLTHPDTSIDVGCMQINTKWHGAFFETIDEMLDPASNVAYAASFITDLYHAHGNWDDAIRHYHSNEAKRNGPYLERVLASWNKNHPQSDRGGLTPAVYQVPLTPIATAADDAFTRALATAKQPPVIANATIPVTPPVAKPPRRIDGGGTERVKTPLPETSDMIAAPVTPTQPGSGKAVDAGFGVTTQAKIITVSQIQPMHAKPTQKPVDPDAALKNRQRNLADQWDRVLMFRSMLAAER